MEYWRLKWTQEDTVDYYFYVLKPQSISPLADESLEEYRERIKEISLKRGGKRLTTSQRRVFQEIKQLTGLDGMLTFFAKKDTPMGSAVLLGA